MMKENNFKSTENHETLGAVHTHTHTHRYHLAKKKL